MRGNGKSALVVDDNKNMRFMLSEMLRGLGFDAVDEAEDLTQANSLIDKRQYDCALVDLELGPESGIELIRSIQSLYGGAMPVLVVSGENVASRVLNAASAGAKGFLLKPFSTAGLAAKLEKTLSHTPSQASSLAQALTPAKELHRSQAQPQVGDDDIYI